jgi:hypothetical protein
VFADAIRAVEPLVAETAARVAEQVDERTADRLSDVVRRIFGRVLKELADIDNPLRSPVGDEPGEGALFAKPPRGSSANGNGPNGSAPRSPEPPDLSDLVPPPVDPVSPEAEEQSARPARARTSHLPTVAADPAPTDARSRFDPESGVVFFNDRHADYLLVKESEPALLDYLATLVAKELVVYNNPRSAPEELAEEMVRMLVRVRRHLPKRV